MTRTATRTVPSSPAEVYDRLFVPALFGPWGPRVSELAEIGPGDHVLDVACGTGALALAATDRVGAEGRVAALDPNPEMLAVARRKESPVEWHEGRAEEIPFPEATFDRVVSQFGFMFFDEPVRALREMRRVLRPGGRLVVAVCDAIDHSPGYAVLTELLHRLFGAEVADSFRAPFALGDRDRLGAMAGEAELERFEVRRLDGAVRFASIDALVSAERACAWTLGGLLDDEQFEQLLAAAAESFQPFLTVEGAVEFLLPALCVVAEKPVAE